MKKNILLFEEEILMKKNMYIVIFFAFFICPVAAWADCTQNSNSLEGLVGLDRPDGTVYASIKSTSNECSCTSVRFRPENTDVKAALSIVLAAKLAEKKIRIDFINSSDCNTAYRVYIQ